MSGIVLVEERVAFRQALAIVLERELSLPIVAQVGSHAEARPYLAGAAILLGTVHSTVDAGLDLLREYRRVNPSGYAALLVERVTQDDRARAIEAGAADLLSIAAPIATIVEAVRRLAAGEALVSPQETVALLRLAIRLRDDDDHARRRLGRITPREREVLAALAVGLNDTGMAEQLHMSVRTARTHVANITAKLGVESRLQAVVFAAQHGLVRIG